MDNVMSMPLRPELDTEEVKILHEMGQLFNYVMVAPTLSRQELSTKLLRIAGVFLETLSSQNLKIQSLGKQLSDANEQLENGKSSGFSEPDPEGSVWSQSEHEGSVWSQPNGDGSEWSQDDAEDKEDHSSTEADGILECIKNFTETISSSSSEYVVEKILGSGSFGTVVQCLKKPTNETVAQKIVKGNMENKNLEEAKEEITVGLCFLKNEDIIHMDLKPENIMLENHIQKPLKIQLIDFGEAKRDPQEWIGGTFQTLMYRALEVVLGVLCTHAIDVWSLGCLTAEMLRGTPLFYSHTETELLEKIISVLGQPPSSVLDQGMYTDYYFDAVTSSQLTQDWVFKSSDSTEITRGPNTKLHDLLKITATIPTDDEEAVELDWLCFVDLIQQMLQTDASQRITPEDILCHPFITMQHLNHQSYNS